MKVLGYELHYDPIISLDPRYVALLSQDYTRDTDVTLNGEWITLRILGRGLELLYESSAMSSKLRRDPFDIQLHTTNPGPYHAFILMQWYKSGTGVFTKLFRVKAAISKKGNLLRGHFDPNSPAYLATAREARRQLTRLAKKRRGPSKSGVRPAQEFKDTTYPIKYRYTVHPEWSSDSTGTRREYERGWTGQRTPDYWSKRRRQLPVNPHTVYIVREHVRTLIRHTEWVSDINYGGTQQAEDRLDIVPAYYAVPPVPASFYSDATLNLALSRLITKMGAETANIAQDIGEIGETIRMIHKTIQRVHNANHALRVGNFSGAVNALWSGAPHGNTRPSNLKFVKRVAKTAKAQAKVLAENWLELQYGWKPLLSDIHDAIEKVSLLAQQPGDLIIAAASGSASGHYRNVSDIKTTFVAPLPNHVCGQQTIASYQRDKYGVRFKVADAHKAFLAQTGFTNPIDLAWELLPYSFVVDWFLPIGPWLESFTAFRGLEFVDGYRSRFLREDAFLAINDAVITHQTPDGQHPVIWKEDGLWWRTTVGFVRDRLTTWPLPNLPVVKSPWSTGHVLNALALLGAGFEVGRRYHV